MVATFALVAKAKAAADELRGACHVTQDALGVGTVAGYHEPYDGHTLVAAWVREDQAANAAAILTRNGGVLAPQPWTGR